MKRILILSTVLLCGMLGSCKKDTTSNHVTATVTYTAPPSTQYDTYSLDGNITLTLTTSQNQVVGSAILTQPGTADFGVMPSGTYTIHAEATEKDNSVGGVIAYRNKQGTCTLTTPGVNNCTLALN